MAVTITGVIVAAIGSMILGFLWYGPLFGKAWMAEMKINPKKAAAAKKGMGKSYSALFLSAVVMAYVLGYFLNILCATTTSIAAYVAFWIWLGFIATKSLGGILWEGKTTRLYLLNV